MLLGIGNLTTCKEFGMDGGAYERIENMICYCHLLYILCILVMVFGHGVTKKKGE
jgi:hypothetical protein